MNKQVLVPLTSMVGCGECFQPLSAWSSCWKGMILSSVSFLSLFGWSGILWLFRHSPMLVGAFLWPEVSSHLAFSFVTGTFTNRNPSPIFHPIGTLDWDWQISKSRNTWVHQTHGPSDVTWCFHNETVIAEMWIIVSQSELQSVPVSSPRLMKGTWIPD